MAVKRKPTSVEAMILDGDTPFDHRKQLLMHLCADDSEQSQAALKGLLESATASNGETVYKKKCQELEAIKQQLLDGPLRSATFFRILSPGKDEQSRSGNGAAVNGTALGPLPRAHVLTEEGAAVYPAVVDAKLAASLACGDEVILDAQGKAILYRAADSPDVGEEARFERRVDAERIEVSMRDYEKHVFRTSAKLVRALDAGETKPGDLVLVSSRRWMALDGIPSDDKLSHYQYICKDPVPDVVIERDIGAPPAFIRELQQHVTMEMTNPELGRKYRLMRCRMKLLAGVSGSGKSLSIQGMWRLMYEAMSDVIGVPLEQLPPRVMRLRASSVLSKWYSESEKLLDKFFDEVEQLATETFIGPDGVEYDLPLLVITEEVDSLARTRGSDSVHDRVQTTLLQRLDATTQKLRDKLILFLFTTNVPEMVDPAFLRRAGGTVTRFDRLSQRACGDVLDKHLRDLPIRINGQCEVSEQAKQHIKSRVLPWLFSPNGEDKGLVEITYVGATEPDVKYRRNFLTGALIARAVQEAAEEGRLDEWSGESAGVTAGQLMSALARQIQSIVDQLHTHNVHQYVTLPDAARVGSVRRIPQPKAQPAELSRV
jgi:hypothetical protein